MSIEIDLAILTETLRSISKDKELELSDDEIEVIAEELYRAFGFSIRGD